MAASILETRELEYFIKTFELVPSDGDLFEFEVNGENLFSRKQLKRHPEEGEIKGLFTQQVKQYKQANHIFFIGVDE